MARLKTMRMLDIPQPRGEITSTGRHRVSAAIAGEDVWFECDKPLTPSPEAFASAFLLPTMAHRGDLRVHAPVCPVWRDNMIHVRELARKWWHFSGGQIECATMPRTSNSSEVALFFSGGVDSFFTLLTAEQRPSSIIFIEGFDIPLADTRRLDDVRGRLRAVAQAKQLDLINVRTNLREHHLFKTICWALVSHGVGLAATGHCLASHASTFLIASTGIFGTWGACGSHPDLDPFWSSRAVRFVHHAPTVARLDRIKAIVHDPVVQEHLRVCWENRTGDLNCGQCEKCLRTQLQMLVATPHEYARQRCFPTDALAPRVHQLDRLLPHLEHMWRDIELGVEDVETRSAVTSLLERSKQLPRRSLGKRLRSLVMRLWR